MRGSTPSAGPGSSPAASAPTSPSESDTPEADANKADASSSDQASAGGAQGSERASAIQEALKEKGHDPGQVHGIVGPRTRAALREFQKAEGVEPTGRPDEQTVTALGIEQK